jgi:hypothetical protein
MAISAVLMRRLKEFLSSKMGNSLLPRGTSSPFSDLISTTTVFEKWYRTLRICVCTLPDCLSLGEFWPAAIVGAARQSTTSRGRHIKIGKDVWNVENKFRRNCNLAPLANLNAKFARFFGTLVSAATQEVFAPGFPSDAQAGGRATASDCFLTSRNPQIPVQSCSLSRKNEPERRCPLRA